jgi:signal transduction histidine kinase
MWTLRLAVVAGVLAAVSVAHPAPGLSGRHLVLLVGMVVAALAWQTAPPAERLDQRVSLGMLTVGMVGGCLAALVSPHSAALTLPAVIGLVAGSSFPPLESAGVAACGLVTLGVGSIVVTSPGFSLLGSCLAVAGGLLAGLWRRQYRLRVEQAELAAVEAQRAIEEHGRAQVLDERARLAREIHDVLAHTLGGLVVELDAADAVLGDAGDLEKGRSLVIDARRLAVAGLEETRRAIAALRADPVALPEMLAGLASRDGQGGQVTNELRGTPRELAPAASLALYRTAQEALANARKHAPGAEVDMSLTYGEGTTVLRVANDAPPGGADAHPLASTGGGYGLSGLEERAELLGGTLRAEASEGGWVVELRLPV